MVLINRMLLQLCVVAAFLYPVISIGQSGTLQESTEGQLLSSYEGRISRMLTITTADFPTSNYNKPCDLFPGRVDCCPLVAVNNELSITTHKFLSFKV